MTREGFLAVPEGTTDTNAPPPLHVALLLYALTGGVVWWAAHLVGLSVTEPAVCDGLSRWVLTAINVVSVLGVLSALVASVVVGRAATAAGGMTGRSRFLGHVAVVFNVVTLALVVLESVPVYVLEPCS